MPITLPRAGVRPVEDRGYGGPVSLPRAQVRLAAEPEAPESPKPTAAPSKLTDYIPDVVRGVAGLVPKWGWRGAAAAGGADLAAQKIEMAQGRRDSWNPWRTAAESAVGAVPFGDTFGGVKGMLRAAGKGAAITGGGAAANELAETGTITPTQVAIASSLGGLGGTIAQRAFQYFNRGPKTLDAPSPSPTSEGSSLSRWFSRFKGAPEVSTRPVPRVPEPSEVRPPRATLPVDAPRPDSVRAAPPAEDDPAVIMRTVANGSKRAAEREARMTPTPEEAEKLSLLSARLERLRQHQTPDSPRTYLERVPDLEDPPQSTPMLHRPLSPDQQARQDTMFGKGSTQGTKQHLNTSAVRRYLDLYGKAIPPGTAAERHAQYIQRGRAAKEFRRLTEGEGGGISSELAMRLGLAGAGAVVGPIFEPEHPVVGAVGGAAMGAALPTLVKRGSLPERLRYFSMLSRPLTHAKAALGNTSGLVQEAAVKGMTGDTGAAKNILREMGNVGEHKRVFTDAFKNPESYGQRFEQDIPLDNTFLSIPRRILTGLDAATTATAERAGIGRARGQKIGFSNEPETGLGQWALEGQRRFPAIRLLQAFVKTGVNQGERAYEAASGFKHVGKLLRREGLSQDEKEHLARAVLMTGVAGTGAAGVGSANPLAVAAAGPLALPYLAGAVGHEIATDDRKDTTAGALRRFMARVTRDVPFMDVSTDFPKLVGSYVPGALGDLNPDPYPRVASGGLFGEAMKKIPGVSERLKIAGARKNQRRLRRPPRRLSDR